MFFLYLGDAPPPPPATPPNNARAALMTSETLVNVTTEEDGSFTFHYETGVVQKTRAELADEAAEGANQNELRKLLRQRWVGLNPDLNDPSVINGTRIEVVPESLLNFVSVGRV